MRSLGVALGCLALIAACGSTAGSGGGGGLAAADAFTKACTQETAAACAGQLCLTLQPNKEDKAGICTAACGADAQCPGGVCLHIANGTIDQSLCFRSCQADGDCSGGLACITADTSGRKICLVHAAPAGTPCTTSSDCTEADARCTKTDSGLFCTGALDAPDVFQRECRTANDCPGLACLTFNPNQQEKAGICTLACANDGDCPRGFCAQSPVGKYCLSTCGAGADCANGFVCVPASAGTPAFCGVDPK